MLWTYNPRQGFDKDVGTYPNFDDWRRQNTSFERLAAYTGGSYTLTEAGDPAQIRGAIVTPGFFETLGVAAMRGRVFGEREGTAGGELAVILAHGFWQRRFGGDAGIVGRTVMLNGVSHEVVGVMPEGFAYPEQAELWTPLAPSERFAQMMQSRGSFWLTIIGRLRAGVTRGTAQSDMDGIAARLERQYPANEGLGVRLVPMHEEIVGDVTRPLLILLGAVCFVLLIACANVANLLLTRAASRQKELAIRGALGAGRARLIRQMLTESVLLGALGGVAGLLIAAWGVDLLHTLAPTNVPRLALVTIDPRVLAYTACASLLTGLLFGLVPAFQGATNPGDALKEGGRAGAEGGRGRRLRSALAVVEIATALVLLIGAGLLVRSFIAMSRVTLGFEARQILALRRRVASSQIPAGTASDGVLRTGRRTPVGAARRRGGRLGLIAPVVVASELRWPHRRGTSAGDGFWRQRSRAVRHGESNVFSDAAHSTGQRATIQPHRCSEWPARRRGQPGIRAPLLSCRGSDRSARRLRKCTRHQYDVADDRRRRRRHTPRRPGSAAVGGAVLSGFASASPPDVPRCSYDRRSHVARARRTGGNLGGGSGPTCEQRAYARGHDRRRSGESALYHIAARHLRGSGVDSGSDWRLRRDRLFHGAANAGDRHPHGPRCHATTRHQDGRERRTEDRRLRDDRRRSRSVRPDEVDGWTALRGR